MYSGQSTGAAATVYANGRVVQLPLRYFTCHHCKLQEICVNARERGSQPNLTDIIDHPRLFRRGDYLFRQGDPVRYFYIINSGVTKQFITSPEGAEKVVGFSLVGESVSLDYCEGGRHNSNVIALDTANVCAISVNRLNREKGIKAELTDCLFRHAVSEINRHHELQQLMGHGAAENKLAFFLNDMASRLQNTGQASDAIVLVMSRHDIANYLCLADETVSRLFRKFSDWRILDIDRKQFRIIDFAALRSMACGNRYTFSDTA